MNQRQNGTGQRPPYDPRREAAKRAYYKKKKKRIIRNRIILGIVALLVLALLILVIVLIGKGIARAVEKGKEGKETERMTDTAQPNESREPYTTESGEKQTQGGEQQTEPPESQTERKDSEQPVPEIPEFEADLRDYERYMEPTEDDGYLILVNPDHPLTAADVPTDLVDVINTRKDGRDTQKMRYTAEKALEALYLEAQAEGVLAGKTPSGYVLSVTSAYRDYGTQNYLFSNYTANEMKKDSSLTREQAEKIVETYSCRPGTSEHQTGLCCDMHTLSSADISFAGEKEAEWLEENAWKFGFILRFPKDKVNVTGISYEPWHFRFVGRTHAYRIHEAGLCLEEYIEQLSQQ